MIAVGKKVPAQGLESGYTYTTSAVWIDRKCTATLGLLGSDWRQWKLDYLDGLGLWG